MKYELQFRPFYLLSLQFKYLSIAASIIMAVGCGGSGGGDDSDDVDPDLNVTSIDSTLVAGVIDSADGMEQNFGFVSPSNGIFNILLEWPNPASDLDMVVTDGIDSYFTFGESNIAESINVAMVKDELWAIAVTSFSTAGPQDFTIGVNATTEPAHSPGHVESEPNDSVATANVIGFGQVSGIVNDDVPTCAAPGAQDDFFIYLAPNAGTYQIDLTWTNSMRDLDLTIGSDSPPQTSAQTNTEFESLTQALNNGEQLRILVCAFFTDNNPVSYNLVVEEL